MTRLKSLIGCALLFLVFSGNAQQFSKDYWHDGFAVTNDGDTIRGKIKYDMDVNTVFVSRNKIVQTFTSQKLFYTNFFDQLTNTYRQFYAIPYKVKPDYETPIFFELLYEGYMSLLAREVLVVESVNTTGMAYGTYMHERMAYQFFLLNEDGTMQQFDGSKKDLLYILSDEETRVKSFIKKNKLRVDDMRDLIRVIAFYNSLINE